MLSENQSHVVPILLCIAPGCRTGHDHGIHIRMEKRVKRRLDKLVRDLDGCIGQLWHELKPFGKDLSKSTYHNNLKNSHLHWILGECLTHMKEALMKRHFVGGVFPFPCILTIEKHECGGTKLGVYIGCNETNARVLLYNSEMTQSWIRDSLQSAFFQSDRIWLCPTQSASKDQFTFRVGTSAPTRCKVFGYFLRRLFRAQFKSQSHGFVNNGTEEFRWDNAHIFQWDLDKSIWNTFSKLFPQIDIEIPDEWKPTIYENLVVHLIPDLAKICMSYI